MSMDWDCVIVGAGLAGLSCADNLVRFGKRVLVLEAADRIGGRVWTERVGGWQFDAGFQVLLTAYPQAREQLDLQQLRLRPFYPGALVRHGGRFVRVADPLRRPVDAIRSLGNGIGSVGDKLRVARLRLRPERLRKYPDTMSTADALASEGFGQSITERFFRPFLGGVFLENKLETSVRRFESVFTGFAAGDTALPERGIGAIPEQIAARLPAGAVRLGCAVRAVSAGELQLDEGVKLRAKAIVLAAGPAGNARLLGQAVPPMRSTACLYYRAPRAPHLEPVLVLNADADGPIQTLVPISQVSRSYAPPGEELVSVSVVDSNALGSADLEWRVRRQLIDWYGISAANWQHLRTMHVPEALPAQRESAQAPAGIVLAGDQYGWASLDAALASGKQTAAAVLAGNSPAA